MADQRTLRVVIVGNASQAQRTLQNLGRDADQLGRHTSGLSGSFAALGGRLAAFGATAAAGLATAGGAAAWLGIKTASSMEQATIAFETLTGSSDKAKKHLADLQKFAAATPFELDGLIESSVKLQGVGVSADQVIPHLRAWGNAASAVGVGGEAFNRVLTALSQAMSAGRFQLEDFNQIADNGIPIYSLLAEATGKPVPELRKLASAGKLSTDTILPLLEKTINSKWGDAMAKQSQTAAGMWSSLSDTVKQALGNVAVAFWPLIKSVLPQVTNGAAALGKAIPPILDRIKTAVVPIAQEFMTVFNGRILPVLRQFGAYIMGTLVPMIRANLTRIAPVFISLARIVTGSILPAFRTLWGGIQPVLSTLVATIEGTVIPALIQLVQAVMPRFQQFAGFIRNTVAPVLAGMFKQAQPVIQQFGQVLATVFQGIGVAVNILAPILQVLWRFLGPIVISTLQGLWSGILGVIKGALNVIQGVVNVFIGIFTGNWSKAWSGVKQIFLGLWQFIVGAIKIYIYGSIVSVVRGGLLRITAFWRAGWNGVRGAFTAVANFIRGGVSSWVGGINRVVMAGVNVLRRIWSLGWSGIRTTISVNVQGVLQIVRGVPSSIIGFFRSLPADLTGIGRNIIQGLVRGIRGSLGAVTGAVKGIIDHIPKPIRKAMGIHSPSRVMAEIGRFITQGLVVGMEGGTKKVEATARKLDGLIWQAFSQKKISKRAALSIGAYIQRENKAISNLSRQREQVAAKLQAANDKLTSLRKARADLASNVAGKAKDFGSILGVFDSSQFADNSASAIVNRLRGKLNAIVKFRQNLSALAKRGLGPGIISEIAQAGPDEGAPIAAALLRASGTQIEQLNSTYKAIGAQSNALGNSVANDYYGAGIRAAEGLVKGLQSQESKLTGAIDKMSKAMVKALKKALGIKSPSRVFRTQGRFTGQGFALGVEDEQERVQRAVNGLAGTRPTGRLANRSIARETALRGASRGTPAPVVYVTVQGNVTAEKALARSIATTVRDEIVRTGKRNGGRTGF